MVSPTTETVTTVTGEMEGHPETAVMDVPLVPQVSIINSDDHTNANESMEMHCALKVNQNANHTNAELESSFTLAAVEPLPRMKGDAMDALLPKTNKIHSMHSLPMKRALDSVDSLPRARLHKLDNTSSLPKVLQCTQFDEPMKFIASQNSGFFRDSDSGSFLKMFSRNGRKAVPPKSLYQVSVQPEIEPMLNLEIYPLSSDSEELLMEQNRVKEFSKQLPLEMINQLPLDTDRLPMASDPLPLARIPLHPRSQDYGPHHNLDHSGNQVHKAPQPDVSTT